jgi:hypothetical protein
LRDTISVSAVRRQAQTVLTEANITAQRQLVIDVDALVIWGEKDHEVRAKTLATTYATTAVPVDSKPKKVKNLDTLVFWGHGVQTEFCGLTPDEFLDLVASWKKLNSNLQTIEILTCNARHKQGNHADSYTDELVKKTSTKHAGLRFRALPVAVTKKPETCEFSVLKFHAASSTWAYIGGTGTNDTNMWAASKKLEDFIPPRGDKIGYVQAASALTAFTARTTTDAYSVKRKWKQADVDKYNIELKNVRDNTSIMVGTIGMLRWALTDIK